MAQQRKVNPYIINGDITYRITVRVTTTLKDGRKWKHTETLLVSIPLLDVYLVRERARDAKRIAVVDKIITNIAKHRAWKYYNQYNETGCIIGVEKVDLH